MKKLIFPIFSIIIIAIPHFTLFAEPLTDSSDNSKKGFIVVNKICRSNSMETSLGNPCGGNRDLNYSVGIDSLAKIKVSSDSCITFTNLELNKKHKVTIFLSGKPVESFWFTFKKAGSDSLALWCKELYETWSLTPLKSSYTKKECNK
jgi:hypothetical protein